jgi:5'(3')-deoxyribonucleotidase
MFLWRYVNFCAQFDNFHHVLCSCTADYVFSTITDHMQALNPKTENLKPLRPFLDMAPVRILGLLLDVKAEVRDRTAV